MTSRSKCDRCRGPLYGLIPCPACRRLIVDEAVAEAIAAERARLAEAVRGLDWEGCGGYGCMDQMGDTLAAVLDLLEVPVPPQGEAAPTSTDPEHVLDGLTCWCRPYPDPEDPEVIIHRKEARA